MSFGKAFFQIIWISLWWSVPWVGVGFLVEGIYGAIGLWLLSVMGLGLTGVFLKKLVQRKMKFLHWELVFQDWFEKDKKKIPIYVMRGRDFPQVMVFKSWQGKVSLYVSWEFYEWSSQKKWQMICEKQICDASDWGYWVRSLSWVLFYPKPFPKRFLMFIVWFVLEGWKVVGKKGVLLFDVNKTIMVY